MRINCDQSDNFHGLWQKVVDEFGVILASADDERKESLSNALERATDVLNYDNDTGPNQVRIAFRHVTALAPVVIFFDEFDQVQDEGTLSLFSNTIKLLSDQVENITLIPVGVSDSVAGLIAGHVSIQRNLVQVRMPRMARGEIEGILDNGLGKLGMSIEDPARSFVRVTPRGLPQYAHMLAQEGARQALVQGQSLITFDHLIAGMKVGLEKLEHSLASAYDEATYTARPSNYADVLFACVWGQPDADGYFSPASIREPFSIIVGKPREIDNFNPQLKALSEGRGEILHRKGPTHGRRYRFSDPLMEPYVLLRGISSGRIDVRRLIGSDGDPTEPPQLS
jgi:hypothetical protein